MRFIKLLFLVLLISQNSFSQQVRIYGRIIDGSSKRPLDNCLIYISDGEYTTSNANGNFEILAKNSNPIDLMVERIGYEDFFIKEVKENNLLINLKKTTIKIHPLEIQGPEISEEASEDPINLVKKVSKIPYVSNTKKDATTNLGFLNKLKEFIKKNFKDVDFYDFTIKFTIDKEGKIKNITTDLLYKKHEELIVNYLSNDKSWTPAITNKIKMEQDFQLSVIIKPLMDISKIDLSKIEFHLKQKLEYPIEALKENIEGIAIIEFGISDQGKIEKIKPLSKIGYGLESNAINVIQSIPVSLLKDLYEKTKFKSFVLPVSYHTGQFAYRKAFQLNPKSILLNPIEINFDEINNEYKNYFNSETDQFGTYRDISLVNKDSKIFLKKLSLSNENLKHFPKEVLLLENLVQLDISINTIPSLPEEITSLYNLKELFLGYNSIDSLPKNIQKLKNLQVLRVNHNKISKLKNEIFQLHNLQVVDFSKNNLTEIPDSIKNLKSLRYLNLSGNSISHIPEEIYELKSLQYINLSGNKLTDSTKSDLKEKFKNITLIL